MKRIALRFVLGMVAFVGVMLLGYGFGIHPTLAEALLVVVACGASDAIHEVLR